MPEREAGHSFPSNAEVKNDGMDVCVRLFCVCVVLCVGSGLATG
jgi:hypothetical protein